jgi:hypothetical protein
MKPFQSTREINFKGKNVTIKYVDIMEMVIIVSDLENGINKQYPQPTLKTEKRMQSMYADVIDDVLNNIN